MSDDLSHPFFEEGERTGAPMPDDWEDPDFDRIEPPENPMPSFGSAAVLVALMALSATIAREYVDELRYVFTDSAPMELGYADELFDREELWDGHLLVLPSNRYVRVEGGVDRPSTSRDKTYYKLLGTHIYVESVNEEHETQILRNEELSTMAQRNRDLELHDQPGRLVAFEDLPSRYTPVVQFYSDATRTWFCGHEPSRELVTWRNNQRGRAEVALEEELGRLPSEAEIDGRLGADAGCQRGYMLFQGVSPRGSWWIVLIYALLVGLFSGCVHFLARWVRAFRRARGG